MSLSLIVNETVYQIGSYHKVVALKINMINATIEYLGESYNENNKKLIDKLKSSIKVSEGDTTIDYSVFSKLIICLPYELNGLYDLVNHIEPGGLLFVEQSESILKTLNIIYQYLDDGFFIGEKIPKNFYLYQAFKESINTNKYIFLKN